MNTTRDRLVLPAFGYSTKAAPSPDGQRSINVLADPILSAQLGLSAEMFGGRRGYNQSGDVIRVLNDGVPTNDMWAEFNAALALLNAERQPLVDFLTYSVTNTTERIAQVSGTGDFEKASEFGVPVGVSPTVSDFTLGFDFAWYDTASRYTWMFLAEASSAQVQSINAAILEMDNRLVFTEIMRTLFRNDNRTADIAGNPYNVYTFYNGDGTVPPAYRANTFAGSHTHYLVSGAATIDSGDLDESISHLEHHGYSSEEGADLVIMLNEAQGNVVRNFRSIRNGGTSLYDFVPAQGEPSFLTPVGYTPDNARRPAGRLRGMRVIGAYGSATIVQESFIPAGYLVAFATGGRASAGNPIGIREHARPELRGLRLVQGRSNTYPLQDSYYQRGFGTGVRHRGAGLVMKIAATGAYTAPAAYAVV